MAANSLIDNELFREHLISVICNHLLVLDAINIFTWSKPVLLLPDFELKFRRTVSMTFDQSMQLSIYIFFPAISPL